MRDNYFKRIAFFLLLASVLLPLSCRDVGWSTPLVGFVEEGLSTVFMRSYSKTHETALETIPSRVPIRITLSLVNPKGFDLEAAVSASPATRVLLSDGPRIDSIDPGTLVFSLTAHEEAEWKDLDFSIQFHAGAINKTWESESLRLRVDSPPELPVEVVSSFDSDNKSFVAWIMPEGLRNEDIVEVEIAAQPSGGGAAIIRQVPVSIGGNWLRWSPPGAVALRAYSYHFVSIDRAGLRSAASPVYGQDDRYLVFYNSNGGEGVVLDPTGYDEGAPVSLRSPENTLQRIGYEFGSWNTRANGSGSSYTPAATLPMPRGGLELWAHWTPIVYTVSLDTGGGSLPGGITSPLSYTIESPELVLPIPNRSDYRFDGWFANSSFTGQVQSSIPEGSTGNRSYYAKWTQYGSSTISMSIAGGTELAFTQETSPVSPGTEITISADGVLASGGINWVWRRNGAVQSAQTTSSFSWTPSSSDIGQHIISCELYYQGLSYSGNVTILVNN